MIFLCKEKLDLVNLLGAVGVKVCQHKLGSFVSIDLSERVIREHVVLFSSLLQIAFPDW